MFGLHSSILLPSIVTKQGQTYVGTFGGGESGKSDTFPRGAGRLFLPAMQRGQRLVNPVTCRRPGNPGNQRERRTEGALFV